MNFGMYYPPFNVDYDDEVTIAPRWMEWINGFDLMLKNCSIDQKDKLPMLLRFSGRGVRDIFTTLTVETDDNAEETFAAAKKALGDYFRSLSLANVTYQSYIFSWMRQEECESFEAFVSRLREAAVSCRFKADTDRRIRDQIVKGCRSDDVRRQAFLGDLSLEDLVRVGIDLQDSDDTDAGLLTSFGNVLSVFAPESASHLTSIRADGASPKGFIIAKSAAHHRVDAHKETVTKRAASTTTHAPSPSIRSNASRGSPAQTPSSDPSEQSQLSQEELKKERAKEKRRRQRRETYEAAKVKPFEELTDKQKKLLQYQERFRQKLTARLQDRKRGFIIGAEPDKDGWLVEDEIGSDE